jgi:hypothetical protein
MTAANADPDALRVWRPASPDIAPPEPRRTRVAAAGAMGDGVVVYRDDGSGGGDYVCDLVRRAGVGRSSGVRSE